ncbi:MAG: hypothetical protein DRI46_09420 [Chloroflexi bacterium]|nr:MAG: hypothetical protein DRI46_09420 [Chloroflexota bacterium]
MTAVQGSIQSLGITIYQVFHEDIKSALDSIFSLTQRMIEFSQANTETVKLLAKIALAAAAVGPALLVLSKVFQLFSFTFQIIGRGIAVFGGLINIILKTIGALGRLAGIIFNVVGKALLLLGQLIFAVSKQMFIFAFKATAALAKSIFTLLVPAFAALNRLLLRLAFQAILAVAAVGKLTLSFVVLATQSAILHIGKVSAWIIEVGIAAIGTVAALAPMVAAFLAIGAAIGVVIVAAFALVGAFRQLAGKVAEALGRVSETIAGFFGGIKKDGESWGEGLSKAYAEGIVEGAVYIIEALSAIGNAIAYWLQTFSPPKLLPDLTKWGTGAMQAYMDGWLKADFSVLFEIGDTIQSHLEAMSEDIKDSATKISIAEAVLGSRESIAEAIAQIKLTGTITEDMFQKIFESIGMVTPQLDGYIRATLNMVVANKRLAVAQEEVNRVNQKYADLLAPISGRLKEIENIRQDIADTARLDELESVLADTNISDRVRELAALEIEEITLQGQQRDIETERDSAVAIAGQQLDEAKAQAAIATAQLEHAQGLIDLAQSQTDILRDMLDESKSSADSLKEISKKLGDALSGGGGGIDTSPLDPESWLNGGDPGDLGGGLIDKKIEALKESLGGLKDSWVGVWDEITRIAGDKFNTIKGKWKALVWTMNHKWGNLINSVKEAGTEIWDSLKETWEDIWGETDNFTAFNVQMGLLMDYLQDDAPGAIENFADTVANSWIPAIGSIIKSLLDPEGLLHAIAKVFLSVSLFIIQPIVATLLLEEALDDLSGAIGRLGYKVGTYLRGKVKDAIDSFGEWHDGIRDSHPIYDTFLKVLGNVWTIFKKLWIIQLLLLGILTAVAEYIFTAVITAFEGILLALGTLHDYIRDYVNKILVELFGKTEDVADETSDWGDFVDTLHGYWITFVDWIQNTLLGVLNDINEALGNASGWLDGMIEKLKEFLVKVQQGKDAIKSVNPFSEDPEDPEDPGKIPETAGVQSAATPVAAGIQSLFGGVTSAFSPSVPGTTGTTGSPGRTARYGIGSRRTSPVPSVISAGANSIIAAGGGLVLNMGPITINDDMDMALFEARVRQVVVSSME